MGEGASNSASDAIRIPWSERLRDAFPLVGNALRDGSWLARFPIAEQSQHVAGLVAGIAAGLMDRSGLPYVVDVGMLGGLMALAILSGRMGVWAFVGFVCTDVCVKVAGEAITAGFIGGVIVSWLLLFQLLVSLPLTSRLLGQFQGRLTVLNGLVGAVFMAGFAELWTRISMVALRPLYTWRGQDPPLELVNFIEPVNEWALGALALHKLAWLALAVGLARWLLSEAILRTAPAALLAAPSQRSYGLSLLIKAATFTAILAGLFSSIAGGVMFFATVLTALGLRGLASGNPVIARWDGIMHRIPAAFRLIATYALCFWIAEALVAQLRTEFEMRTLASAATAIAIVHALSLVFWPQVASRYDAPVLPKGLQTLFGAASRVAPPLLVMAVGLGATAAQAHHCSFLPGCECLTDDRALAALVAAAAAIFSPALVPVGLLLRDSPAPQLAPAETDLQARLQSKVAELRFAQDAGQSGRIALEFFDLLKQGGDAAGLIRQAATLGIDTSGFRTGFSHSVGGALAMLVDPTLEWLGQQAPNTFLANPNMRAGIGAGIRNGIYLSTGDAAGVVMDASFQFIGIAIGMKGLKAESTMRVADRLDHAIMVADALRQGRLSYPALQQDIATSRAIEAELDPGPFNYIQQRAVREVNIINDLLDLASRQHRGEDIGPDIERLSRAYRDYAFELPGGANISEYYVDFAGQVAKLIGVRGW